MPYDHEDIVSLPEPLWLNRTNIKTDIIHAMRVVDSYLPIPDFDTEYSSTKFPSTTVISAFYPPPPGENLVRSDRDGLFNRDPRKYIDGLKVMLSVAQHLVVFVPPGEYADELRAMNASNVAVIDHYGSPWDIPHLQGRRAEFYQQQTQLLDLAYRPPELPYGEPHSWASWNVKSFLILEALKLDPFKTTHFVWLDARVPSFKGADVHQDEGTVGWPNPEAVARAYEVLPTAERAIVVTFDRRLASPETPYWPTLQDVATGIG